MEDDLNILKMEDDFIILKMEEDLNILKMEDDLKNISTGRWPQFVAKWKTTSISPNGRQPQYSVECKTSYIYFQMEDDLKKIQCNQKQSKVKT